MTGGNVAVHDDACHTTLVAMVTVVISNRHITCATCYIIP